MLLLLFVLAAVQHDISKVEPVAPDAAIATPVPDREQKRLKRYDLPELAGAKQALGPQLIEGRLPKPLVDFITVDGTIQQRISIFEGGLVVVKMTGAASIQKKVIIPQDALQQYMRTLTVSSLKVVDQRELPAAEAARHATIRIYAADGTFTERIFHPDRVPPKELNDHVAPLRDLLRAISEDRGVTTSLAGYEPKEGDELVADDHKVYRVTRVATNGGIIELRCLDAPTMMYVAKKDLYLYFLGRRAD
ncbi:MAG TPA: hypothetical protein VGD79_11655 [Thermoanaerobaculia bacterium]|jgi:hypothetical protein